MGLFDRVAQRSVRVDVVMVAAADPGSLHVAVPHKISDDRLGGALGDPDSGGNIPGPDAGVTGDADQHMAMVGEERPAWPCRFLRGVIGAGHALKRSWLRETTDGSGSRTARPVDLREANQRCMIHDMQSVDNRRGDLSGQARVESAREGR
jgi:hypothetical protein